MVDYVTLMVEWLLWELLDLIMWLVVPLLVIALWKIYVSANNS